MAIAALFAIGQAPVTSEAAGEDKLEVFSWWTSGGEAAALNGLFNIYKKQDPGVEIVNATVAGGGGSAARPVLQTVWPEVIRPTAGKPIPVGNCSVST